MAHTKILIAQKKSVFLSCRLLGTRIPGQHSYLQQRQYYYSWSYVPVHVKGGLQMCFRKPLYQGKQREMDFNVQVVRESTTSPDTRPYTSEAYLFSIG